MRRLHIVWFLRLLLAAVFLLAAYSKWKEPLLVFAMSVDSYQLLPEYGVLAVAYGLPPLELAIGVGLLVGWKLRYFSFAGMTMLLLFFGLLLYSFGKGMTIDCGCFGVGEALSARTLIRDGLLVAASVALWRLSSTASQ